MTMPTIVGPEGPCKDCNATGLRGDTALCATCDGSGGFVTTPDEPEAAPNAFGSYVFGKYRPDEPEATEVAEPVLRDS